MGHGTEAESNGVYARLQEILSTSGYDDYYIGTVEAEPTLEDVIAALEENGEYKKVVLVPLMLVAGDHANNDMAGDEEDSWKSILTMRWNVLLKAWDSFLPFRIFMWSILRWQ